MNFIGLISLISSVVSIATLFMPDRFKKNKIALSVFMGLIVFLCGYIVNLNSQLSRMEKVSRAAYALLEQRDSGFSYEGYIQASLAFLEQNKDIYPDAYNRAKKIESSLKDSNGSYLPSGGIVSAVFEMSGILKGIAILNSYD